MARLFGLYPLAASGKFVVWSERGFLSYFGGLRADASCAGCGVPVRDKAAPRCTLRVAGIGCRRRGPSGRPRTARTLQRIGSQPVKRSRDETLRLDRLRRARLDLEQWRGPRKLGQPGLQRLPALVERVRSPQQVPDAGRRAAAKVLA